MWGENLPSLKSCLSAGYGIICITGAVQGLAQMRYPSNDRMWSQERVDRLIRISRALMEPLGKSEPDDEAALGKFWQFLTPEIGSRVVDDFIWIIRDLDFAQDAEIATFMNIGWFLYKGFGNSFEAKQKIVDCIGALRETELEVIRSFVAGTRRTDGQHFPPDSWGYINAASLEVFSKEVMGIQVAISQF